MFKFIHAADVHLDSPLRGLSRYESAPVESIRNACRRAFENLVEFAITEKVAFVLWQATSMMVTGKTTAPAYFSANKWDDWASTI